MIWLGLVAPLLAGCGAAVGGAVAGALAGGDDGAADAKSTFNDVRFDDRVLRSLEAAEQRLDDVGVGLDAQLAGEVAVEFALVDEESDTARVALQFAPEGEAFRNVSSTAVAGGPNPRRLRGAPAARGGVRHRFRWNTAAEPGLEVRTRLRLRVAVLEGGRPSNTALLRDPFTGRELLSVDNTTPPEAEIVDIATAGETDQPPGGPRFLDPQDAAERAGTVRIRYAVRDVDGDPVSVRFFFDGRPVTPFPGAANPVRDLEPGGDTPYEFLWLSPPDVPDRLASRLRVEVFDTKLGEPAATDLVVNNTTPVLDLIAPSPPQPGRVALRYLVTDEAAVTDLFDVVDVEWSFTGADEDGVFRPATEALGFPSNGLVGLRAAPDRARRFTFVWHAHRDVDLLRETDPDRPPVSARAALRLTVRDRSTGAVVEATTSEFDLNQLLVSTAAGGGVGDGDLPLQSSLLRPFGLACDDRGNLYIADRRNHRVRVVASDQASPQRIRTIAGNGFAGGRANLGPAANPRGNLGPATDARLNAPAGVAVDTDGNVYIADSGNHQVRVVERDRGIILRFAGDGTPGLQGDDGPASRARLDTPSDVAVDSEGRVLIADTGNDRLRLVLKDERIMRIAPGAGLSAPQGVFVNRDDSTFWVADTGNHRVLSIVPGGAIEVAAGTGTAGFSGDGGPAATAQLNSPVDVAVDVEGRVFIADTGNDRLRMVDVDGTILTVAGPAGGGPLGPIEVPAADLSLSVPSGLAVGEDGGLFLSEAGPALGDSGNTGNRVVRLREDGPLAFRARAWAGNAFREESERAGDIAGSRGCSSDEMLDVRSPGEDPELFGFSGDGGAATEASLVRPGGVALDAERNLWIADTLHDRIRVVSAADGVIETVVPPVDADGGALELPGVDPPSLERPAGVAPEPDGMGGIEALFIADTGNDRVLRVALDPDGTVTGAEVVLAQPGLAPHDLAYSAADDVLYMAGEASLLAVPAPRAGANPGPLLPGDPPLDAAFALTLDIDGRSVIAGITLRNANDRINVQVRRFDPATGECTVLVQGFTNECSDIFNDFVDVPGLVEVGGLAVRPEGDLLVLSNGNVEEVFRFRRAALEVRIASAELQAICRGDVPVGTDPNDPVQFGGTGGQPVALPTIPFDRVAGGGAQPEDGRLACETVFKQPRDIAVDDLDNLYLADTLNDRVRRVALGALETCAAPQP